ncbi:MAG: hypothetical protein E7354_00320 [Clostridiales bacterium]|nr:hypothetical protein [Clostridiales bacterium]
MSAYGKVSYSESDVESTEEIKQDFESTSAVEEQVEKFDNSYTQARLKDLYEQYDKITIDEERIKSVTQVKVNAVSNAIPFRVVLVMTTTVLVTLLLAFLCIYNISVINGMNTNIQYLQEEVVQYEYDLANSKAIYSDLTSVENIQGDLSSMGYGDIASSNIVAISVPEKTEVIELQAETNWFDGFCNFLSQLFG